MMQRYHLKRHRRTLARNARVHHERKARAADARARGAHKAAVAALFSAPLDALPPAVREHVRAYQVATEEAASARELARNAKQWELGHRALRRLQKEESKRNHKWRARQPAYDTDNL